MLQNVDGVCEAADAFTHTNARLLAPSSHAAERQRGAAEAGQKRSRSVAALIECSHTFAAHQEPAHAKSLFTLSGSNAASASGRKRLLSFAWKRQTFREMSRSSKAEGRSIPASGAMNAALRHRATGPCRAVAPCTPQPREARLAWELVALDCQGVTDCGVASATKRDHVDCSRGSGGSIHLAFITRSPECVSCLGGPAVRNDCLALLGA